MTEEQKKRLDPLEMARAANEGRAKVPEEDSRAASWGKPWAETVASTFATIKHRQESEGIATSTPFPVWNNILGGGWMPGLHIIVGATGSGKSVLATHIANAAVNDGAPVGLAPIELGPTQMTTRIISTMAGVHWSKAFRGDITKADLQRIEDHVSALSEKPFIMAPMELGKFTHKDLDRLCEETVALFDDPRFSEKKGKRCPLVIVDFAQIMGREDGDPSDLRQRLSMAVYEVQKHAERSQVAVIMISSTARQYYSIFGGALNGPKKGSGPLVTFDMPEGPPEYGANGWFSNLIGAGKESGEIEYAATSLTCLVKHKEFKDRIRVVMAKNRFMPPKWFPANFNGDMWSVDLKGYGALRHPIESDEPEKPEEPPPPPEGDTPASNNGPERLAKVRS